MSVVPLRVLLAGGLNASDVLKSARARGAVVTALISGQLVVREDKPATDPTSSPRLGDGIGFALVAATPLSHELRPFMFSGHVVLSDTDISHADEHGAACLGWIRPSTGPDGVWYRPVAVTQIFDAAVGRWVTNIFASTAHLELENLELTAKEARAIAHALGRKVPNIGSAVDQDRPDRREKALLRTIGALAKALVAMTDEARDFQAAGRPWCAPNLRHGGKLSVNAIADAVSSKCDVSAVGSAKLRADLGEAFSVIGENDGDA
jgi:hypothetical protein